MKLLISLALFCIFLLPKAEACLVTKPLKEELKKKAKSVFIGKPISYKLIKKGENDADSVIEFEVIRDMRGEKRKRWTISFANHVFGLPKNLDEFKAQYGSEIEVGVMKNISEQKSGWVSLGAVDGKERVAQEPCSLPYLVNTAP